MLSSSDPWSRWYRRMLPAYWAFLFCATHLPKPKLPLEMPESDKGVHFVAFGVLAFLFWRFAQTFDRNLSSRFVWLAFVGLALYAAADEYLQQFVNRSTSFVDWLADLGGIVLVLLLLEVQRRRGPAGPDGGPQAG